METQENVTAECGHQLTCFQGVRRWAEDTDLTIKYQEIKFKIAGWKQVITLAKFSLKTWFVWPKVTYKHLNLGRFHAKNWLLWINERSDITDSTLLNSHRGLEMKCAPLNLLLSFQPTRAGSHIYTCFYYSQIADRSQKGKQETLIRPLSLLFPLPHFLPCARYCSRNLWWGRCLLPLNLHSTWKNWTTN